MCIRDRYGEVHLVNGKVHSIIEKPINPAKGYINAGVYVFKPHVFDYIARTEKSPRGEYEITTTLSLMLKDTAMEAYEIHEWNEIGYPWDMLSLNEKLMKEIRGKVEGEVEPHATLKGEVMVGQGSVIRSGAYIIGPVVIGEECEIGPNCLIRPYTTVGNHCKIGAACEVRNSLIMDGSHIPHHNYVGDSIIGRNCNLGSGTKIANLRLDEKSVHVTVKGKSVDSRRRKLGAIIGDNVKTGINVSIDVGTTIGEGSFIGPGAVVRGSVAPYSKVF